MTTREPSSILKSLILVSLSSKVCPQVVERLNAALDMQVASDISRYKSRDVAFANITKLRL